MVILLLTLFIFYLLHNLVEGIDQIFGSDWFQQIFIYIDGDGFLGIFKFIMSAQNHNFNPGHVLLHNFAQLQPIDKGHFNIRDQDIRLNFLYQRQSQLSVRSLARKDKTMAFPVNVVSYCFADYNFILHQKYLIHSHPPLKVL